MSICGLMTLDRLPVEMATSIRQRSFSSFGKEMRLVLIIVWNVNEHVNLYVYMCVYVYVQYVCLHMYKVDMWD
ncbi:hypothetical protein EON63_11130 [archaeon]|nr:MAG: hypothetical protein EON63_11130 [archaeon]